MRSKAALAADKARDARLRREYGITLAQYNVVLAHQGGRCAGCKRLVKEFKNNLAVDHCHTTGLLRGLLCWHCNKLIGMSHDDAARLLNTSIYLTNPPMVAALGEIFTAPGRVGSKKRRKLLAKRKAT